jgi:hypothetical protein
MATTPRSISDTTSYFDIGFGCPSKIHDLPTTPPPFRFQDLPGELRNQIVQNFLVPSSPIVMHVPRFNRHPSPPPKPQAHPKFDRPVLLTPPMSRSPSVEEDRSVGHSRLALMLTCRQLYREHWRTYYGDNMFVFSLDVFKQFARDIPHRCWSHIRKIAFRMPHRHHHSGIWKMLSTMKSLEEIELWIQQPVITDETVFDCAVEGVKVCKNLKSFKIRRTDEEPQSQDVIAKDEELQEYIDNILESRKGATTTTRKRPAAPAYLDRKLTDPFGQNLPDTEVVQTD